LRLYFLRFLKGGILRVTLLEMFLGSCCLSL
jgi:hypothetical protein